MNIHFENWSTPLVTSMLPPDLPNEGTLIKVYASDGDPRELVKRPGLVVVEGIDTPFDQDEVFEYPQRGAYPGQELEATLASYNLDDIGIRTVRSLFRCANEHGSCQEAMEAKRGDDWLIDHPFGIIDGIGLVKDTRTKAIDFHLDIFFPYSLKLLRENVVDYDDSAKVLSFREGRAIRKLG